MLANVACMWLQSRCVRGRTGTASILLVLSAMVGLCYLERAIMVPLSVLAIQGYHDLFVYVVFKQFGQFDPEFYQISRVTVGNP